MSKRTSTRAFFKLPFDTRSAWASSSPHPGPCVRQRAPASGACEAVGAPPSGRQLLAVPEQRVLLIERRHLHGDLVVGEGVGARLHRDAAVGAHDEIERTGVARALDDERLVRRDRAELLLPPEDRRLLRGRKDGEHDAHVGAGRLGGLGRGGPGRAAARRRDRRRSAPARPRRRAATASRAIAPTNPRARGARHQSSPPEVDVPPPPARLGLAPSPAPAAAGRADTCPTARARSPGSASSARP